MYQRGNWCGRQVGCPLETISDPAYGSRNNVWNVSSLYICGYKNLAQSPHHPWLSLRFPTSPVALIHTQHWPVQMCWLLDFCLVSTTKRFEEICQSILENELNIGHQKASLAKNISKPILVMKDNQESPV